MNDSDKKEEQETSEAARQERLSEIKATTGIIRECLIKIGLPSMWGTLIAATLGAGMAVLISLSSTGCHGLTNWSMEGEQGNFLMKKDPVQHAISIKVKRNLSDDGEK